MSTSPRPQRRTCVTCRARKVRCDGRRGICTNCERLSFACSYDDNVGVEMVAFSSGDGNMAAAAITVPRRRARRACQHCHARKARCSGPLPTCDRCRAHGLECVYRPGKRSLPLPSQGPSATPSPGGAAAGVQDGAQMGTSSPNDHGTSASSTGSPAAAATIPVSPADPGEALSLRAFDSFFRHVHHIPMFSFLHRASLMDLYHAGSLDRSLVLALVGITALLTDLGPGTEDYGNRCIEEAVSLCLAALERPSIPRLQTLVIAVKHRILSKRYPGAFMLHAIASRYATALRLNREHLDLSFLARESRRRLMWSLYMVDSFISAGQRDLALWPDAEHQIHVQLPCNERNFDFALPEPTELLRPPPPDPGGIVTPLPDVLGFMALHVRIHWMRTRILQRTSKAVAASRAPADGLLAMLPGQCAELAAELDAFKARLPPSFRWSEDNLRLRIYSPRLGIFIMTHVWWRQCHLDLYRLFLPGLKEALAPAALQRLDPQFVAHKQQTCYDHAMAMADMFAKFLALGSSAPVTDIDLPGCAHQCVRVLYHGLQTGGGGDPHLGFAQEERVRELASVCLRAARQSTPGPASASIVRFLLLPEPLQSGCTCNMSENAYSQFRTFQQADIERLIAHGLSLPEVVPPASSSVAGRTRGPPTVGMGGMSSYLGQQPIPDAAAHAHAHAQLMTMTLASSARSDQPPPVEHIQMPVPVQAAPAVTSMESLQSLPVAGTVIPSVNVAPAPPQVSSSIGTTSASNAFEEQAAADGLNFGPELLGVDESWLADSPGCWSSFEHFAGTGLC